MLRSFAALAYVPEDRAVEYLNVLSESVPQDSPEKIRSFVEFMAKNYMGQDVYEMVGGNGNCLVISLRREKRWKKPKFSPRLWTVYERVLTDEPRIPNVLEGLHRRFGTIVAK